ncbi:hypothetical protein SCHPADRAFT_944980 [Schizopora paradoxa]|uniref:Protein kinase domain-containing protein n=1 Tax=Schizopora paradoxa TaxID=27342 RepID=A0A0H2RSE1_9AGAM|nr:hypothetical protein SCHPADRAFT_944980 [Schizopora paradoxa]
MLHFNNYRAVQIRLPRYGFPKADRDPFDLALVHQKYPEPVSPQKDLFKITDFEEIQFEITYGVCRAWTGPKDRPGSIPFIIKFAIAGSDDRHEALREEAVVYHECVPSLQGNDVPIFYGYFEGEKLKSNGKRVSCIFLEDCGEPLYDSFFVDLPLSNRAEIFKKIGRIHLCGMILDDFHEGNVVRKGNSYRVIDFQRVVVGHKCLWKSDQVYEGDLVPTFSEIGCPKMHNLGLELDLWKSPGCMTVLIHFAYADLSVYVLGLSCPRSEYPTQEAIDTLCKGVVFHQFDHERKLQYWVKKYKQYEDSMTPEEYMEKFQRPTFEKKYFGIRMDRDSEH